jgi:hypothetical protein
MKLLSKLAVVVVALGSVSANADLFELDFNSSGDGLVTLDTDTGLEWLDLTETDGYQQLEIANGAGGFLSSGWQIADVYQVCNLFSYAGGIDIDACLSSTAATLGDVTEAYYQFASGPETASLISLLGPNDGKSSYDWLVGTFFSSNPNDAGRACIFANTSSQPCWSLGSPGGFVVSDLNGYAGSSRPGQGVFLVKSTTVPEPSTLALFGLGLLGMGLARRRKERA